jgi:DNA-3-methyladenine glycosylase
MSILPRSFYTRSDTIAVARELLGKYLVTRVGGLVTAGMITETEAYEGIGDRASHAFGNRRTRRTEIMYSIGGTAYVYLCYGVHSLFNVVSDRENIPNAVLIRGIRPSDGIDVMLARAGKKTVPKGFGIGPGNLSKLMGIHFSMTGLDLTVCTCKGSETEIWIEDRGDVPAPGEIRITPRIGVDYAGEDALRPNRFLIW